jgi:hypothetical protein
MHNQASKAKTVKPKIKLPVSWFILGQVGSQGTVGIGFVLVIFAGLLIFGASEMRWQFLIIGTVVLSWLALQFLILSRTGPKPPPAWALSTLTEKYRN